MKAMRNARNEMIKNGAKNEIKATEVTDVIQKLNIDEAEGQPEKSTASVNNEKKYEDIPKPAAGEVSLRTSRGKVKKEKKCGLLKLAPGEGLFRKSRSKLKLKRDNQDGVGSEQSFTNQNVKEELVEVGGHDDLKLLNSTSKESSTKLTLNDDGQMSKSSSSNTMIELLSSDDESDIVDIGIRPPRVSLEEYQNATNTNSKGTDEVIDLLSSDDDDGEEENDKTTNLHKARRVTLEKVESE